MQYECKEANYPFNFRTYDLESIALGFNRSETTISFPRKLWDFSDWN